MILDEAIRTYLLSKPAFATPISSRLYDIAAPQNAPYPHVTFNQMSGDRVRSLSGSSGLNRATFQFHFWGKKPAESKNISEQFRLVLDGFRGQMGGPGGLNIQAVFVEDDIDLYDDEAFIFHVVRKVVIWHNETRPTL